MLLTKNTKFSSKFLNRNLDLDICSVIKFLVKKIAKLLLVNFLQRYFE